MDFIDDAVVKAKEAIDVVCKKTGEVVDTQKQRFAIASLEAKRDKDFEALGERYFTRVGANGSEDAEESALIDSVKEKIAKINELRDEIRNSKYKRTCPVCGASIDFSAVFCSSCGARVTVESDAE